MVVLDEKPVVEAEAMVDAAAAAHGIFLQGAQAGRGLAGIEDLRFRAGHGLDEEAGPGRHAGKLLEEIEGAPLGGQDRARRAANLQRRFARLERGAVLRPGSQHQRDVLLAKDLFSHGQTGQDAGFLGENARRGLHLRLDAGQRGDVSRAAVLTQRARRRFADDGWVGRGDHVVFL